MVSVSIEYEGELRSTLQHDPSGNTVQTDAPVDNNGKGESFSPTDLCAAALGSCIATIIGMQLEANGVDLKGMRIKVVKEMSGDLPRRIVRLETEIRLPIVLSEAQQAKVQAAAESCPVHHSLHPEIEKPITYYWKDS
ncbi:MAG: OsmC family protein [Lentimonas sp.]